MSPFSNHFARRFRPGGRRYRRTRGALAAAPVLLLLPALLMGGFGISDIPDGPGSPAAVNPSDGYPGQSGGAETTASLQTGSPASSASSAAMPQHQASPRPFALPPTATPKPQPTPIPPTPAPPKPPAGTALTLGVWSGQPWEPANLDAVTALLGRAPSVFLTYQGWDRPFYASDMQEIARRGAAHVVTWVPTGYTLRSITSGSHDAYIRDWAAGAAAWGGRIYLRPMHEMNGDWYSWGRGVNGNTPADFVAAWRHLHDIFVAEGATNVRWVWSPNVRYGALLPLADLYPGSAYVDWLGLDGYNWGLDPHLGQPAWQSFEDIFGATYRELIGLAPGKPMMIAETASTETGGDKAQWILQTLLTDVPRYPAVRAVIWFNQADGPSNFRIDSSAAARQAFTQVLNAAAYSGRLP